MFFYFNEETDRKTIKPAEADKEPDAKARTQTPKKGQQKDWRKEIIKLINSMSGRYSGFEIFSDWIRCLAISIQNSVHFFHDSVWEERERLYLDTMNRYSKEEQRKLCEMSAFLIGAMDDGLDDILGKIYMEAGMGSKTTGQFFTPFNVSMLTAEMSLNEQIARYKDGEIDKITVLEPSCGGGGMIIAAAKVLEKAGINYQTVMDVVAQDMDWKGVYMTYVQLSLYGISATCVQGDTLSDPYIPGKTERSHIMITPRKAGALI